MSVVGSIALFALTGSVIVPTGALKAQFAANKIRTRLDAYNGQLKRKKCRTVNIDAAIYPPESKPGRGHHKKRKTRSKQKSI